MEIKRILDKFDSLMEEKNFDEADRLLEYWIVECEQAGDKRNGFTLLNELVGLYRMRGERPQGMKTCQRLLDTFNLSLVPLDSGSFILLAIFNEDIVAIRAGEDMLQVTDKLAGILVAADQHLGSTF